MIVVPQANILNYRVDFLFELRDSLDLDLPRVGVEINEDGHASYDKKKEEERKKVIEYFDNVLYNLDIKSTASIGTMRRKAEELAQEIIRRSDEMLITYNPNLRVEELEKELLKHNFAGEVVGQFLADHSTGDKIFRLRHDRIAEYLGYSNTKNYSRFREILESKGSRFVRNIDYKIVRKSDVDGSEHTCSDPSQKRLDTLGRRNTGGKARQTKLVLISRPTFHKLCMRSSKPKAVEIAESFCDMHEIIFKYVVASRNKIAIQNRQLKAKDSIPKSCCRSMAPGCDDWRNYR